MIAPLLRGHPGVYTIFLDSLGFVVIGYRR